MNADTAPIAADESADGFVTVLDLPRITLKDLSAGIGVVSAFIGASKDFHNPHSPLAAVRFSGETLKADRRFEIAPWIKRAVMGVPS